MVDCGLNTGEGVWGLGELGAEGTIVAYEGAGEGSVPNAGEGFFFRLKMPILVEGEVGEYGSRRMCRAK